MYPWSRCQKPNPDYDTPARIVRYVHAAVETRISPLRGIEHAFRELGYRLLINTVPHEDDFTPLLGEHNTDGLLVFAGSLNEDDLRRPHDLQFHIVLVHLTPALITVRSPIELIGREAVHQLVNQINGQSAQTIILPTELIIRESCGCHTLT